MDIHKLLAYSVDTKVTYSRSGGGAGAVWLIIFDNTAGIWINCTWRIEHKGHVLATEYDDSTAVVGRLSASVRQLEGKKLLSFELSKQNDLILFFEDGYCAKIFCNISFSSTENGATLDTNWVYSIKDLDIAADATNQFQIVYRKYNS